jgi:tight adherence protein B
MSGDMMIYIIAGLAFVVIAGVGLALAGDGGGNVAKRAKQVAAGTDRKATAGRDVAGQRKRQTQQMLTTLREREEQRRKSLLPKDMKSKIAQAGLTIDVNVFYAFSAVLGLGCAVLAFLSGADGVTVQGITLKSRAVVVILAGFVGAVGLPRFVLGVLTKRRHKKMTEQFGDGIDIIVRGVKSGLPLAECLRIIANEVGEPLKSEFVSLTDNIAMGTSLERALQQFYRRVPLPEVNFFVIVLTIQAKSGGNLSEALGNLSAVIRSRKMMREKVSALSQEAKASAFIIGALPFAVMTMVYLTTPDYMMKLFTTSTGHMILLMGAGMMFTGIMVMRKMINFDI